MRSRSADGAPDAAHVFFALGDRTRLQLVQVLCAGGSWSTTQLTTTTRITRQAVTKHLQMLASAGLVQHLRVGRERLWRIDTDHILQARAMLESLGRQWEEAVRVAQAPQA